jgi:hypothetical protein
LEREHNVGAEIIASHIANSATTAFGGIGLMNANAVESLLRTLPTRQPLPANSIEPRPLMPISAVIWRLNRPEKEVMALLDEGLLLWCFDVKEPKATRPAPRVLTQSVQDYLAGNCPPAEDEETEWQRVASLIFPDKPTIGTCELAQSLNCGFIREVPAWT